MSCHYRVTVLAGRIYVQPIMVENKTFNAGHFRMSGEEPIYLSDDDFHIRKLPLKTLLPLVPYPDRSSSTDAHPQPRIVHPISHHRCEHEISLN
jgi:hypothetical protein